MKRAIWQFRARAALTESSNAWRFITGSAPGMPMHTGQVCVFGGSAELRAAPAEQLALGEQLDVDFQADDDVVGLVGHFIDDPVHEINTPR